MLRYLRLEILRTLRDRRFLFFSLGFPVMLYLLWSNISSNGGADPNTGLQDAEYMMVAFGAYGAVGAAMSTTGPRLANELKSGWMRQLQITPLRAWQVVTARTLTAMVVSLPALLLVAVAAAVTKGVELSPLTWAGTVGLLALATLPFAALGTLIGATVKGDAAQPAMLMLYFPLAIIGGLWVPVSILPSFLQDISPWTPTNRMAELGWDLVGGQAPSLAAVAVLAGWTVGLGAIAITCYRRVTVAS